jgi:hypothetical protein
MTDNHGEIVTQRFSIEGFGSGAFSSIAPRRLKLTRHACHTRVRQ